MPLSIDTVLVQPVNTGSFVGTSGSATLGSGTTAGSTVIITACTGQSSAGGTSGVSTPSGFALQTGTQSSNTRVYVFRRGPAEGLAAGETSWTVTAGISGLVIWQVFELGGLDSVAPIDVQASPNQTTNNTSGTTVTSGTTAKTSTYDGLVLAVHGVWNALSSTVPTLSGQTGGLTEMADSGAANGAFAGGLATSMATVQQLGTPSSSATSSQTLTSTSSGSGYVLVYTAEGAKREANVAFFWGFKVGAGAAGLSTGATLFKYLESVTGSPAITANGLQLTGSASIQNVGSVGIVQTQTIKAALQRVRFRFDTSLPGADLELAQIKPSTATDATVLWYRSASQKLAVKVGAGTEQLSDATVAANTWYSVDTRTTGTTTAFTCDWQVDYGSGPVAQTQATSTAALVLGTFTGQLGWSASSTGTVTYAYAVYSVVYGHYPLGDWTMVLLKVDPASTPTISGTSGNFGVMTANGTVGAWNATSARDAVDDWPPTVGASADGAVATTASVSDYIEFPLETYNASGVGSIRAARVVLPMWAASATACTCRVLGYDGTTATTLFAEADPTTDNTSVPGWVCRMWRPTNGWDQTKLDAAAIRFGSNDATPDVGPHSVGMEVAVQNADTMALFGTLASQKRDSVSGGILAVAVTNPAGQASTLHYEEAGTPTDVPVSAGASHTENIDAPDAPTVNYVAIYPDPEPEPPS